MNTNMENKITNLIVKNVKINKIIFVRSGYNYFKNVTIIARKIRKSLFVFIVSAKRTQR
jgi:hypothetical protein